MFKDMGSVFANEDLSIEYDLGDRHTPIMIECDGWMTLSEAQELCRELTEAIEAVVAHFSKGKIDGGQGPGEV